MFELTTEYTNSRVQFGRPLTGNQVVRHRLAEMLMHYELARSVVAGLCIFPAGTHHAAKLVSAAKVTVAKAFDFIGKQSIQLHGGIGLTDEYELSHHYKRGLRSEEHTSELQSLMRHSYAVFCLKKQKQKTNY